MHPTKPRSIFALSLFNTKYLQNCFLILFCALAFNMFHEFYPYVVYGVHTFYSTSSRTQSSACRYHRLLSLRFFSSLRQSTMSSSSFVCDRMGMRWKTRREDKTAHTVAHGRSTNKYVRKSLILNVYMNIPVDTAPYTERIAQY